VTGQFLTLAVHGRIVEDDDFTEFIAYMHLLGPPTHMMIDTLASCGYTLISCSFIPKENTDDHA
jgi:hypothetical protein